MACAPMGWLIGCIDGHLAYNYAGFDPLYGYLKVREVRLTHLCTVSKSSMRCMLCSQHVKHIKQLVANHHASYHKKAPSAVFEHAFVLTLHLMRSNILQSLRPLPCLSRPPCASLRCTRFWNVCGTLSTKRGKQGKMGGGGMGEIREIFGCSVEKCGICGPKHKKKQGFIWSQGIGVSVLQKTGKMGRKWVENGGGGMGVDGVGMGKDMWYIG